MEGSRDCGQCGAVFEPRREHARFCSAACRMAWNREHTSGPLPGDTALGWSAAAMGDAARRLGEAGDLDLPQALAVISEAVWWVTMVDATVVRYYPDAYDRVLAALDPAARRAAEGRLGGLRFVRNWMGYHADPADFVQPRQAPGGGDLPVAEWTWVPVPAPAAGPAPQGQGVGDEPVPAVPGAAGRADRRGGRRVPVPPAGGRRPRREEQPRDLTRAGCRLWQCPHPGENSTGRWM